MKRLLAPIVLVLLATSCAAPASSPAPPGETATVDAMPTATAMPAGKFKLTTLSGAEITFALPTPATDPAVQDLEAFRAKAGGAPVSYLVADVDNRKGTDMVNMYMVSAFNEEGRQYTFSTVVDAISSWQPSYQADGTYLMPNGEVLSDAAGTLLYSQASELYNANIHHAAIAERRTIILAATDTDLPKEFTRVSVQPSGGGEGEDATPADP